MEQQQFLTWRQLVPEPQTNEGIDPVHAAGPGNGPFSGQGQSGDVERGRQGKIDGDVLVPVARSRQKIDAATVAVDWDTFINATLTITANRVLGNPTNGRPGTWRTVWVVGNDGTDRTLTFGNQYLGDVPTLTDIDNARPYLLMIYCLNTNHFIVSTKRAS